MNRSDLSRAFLVALGSEPQAASGAGAGAELEERLADLWRQGASRWPGVVVDAERFAAHLGERLLRVGVSEGLSGVHASDFYLACACAQADASAIGAFDASFLNEVPLYLAPLGRGDAFTAEIVQELREKLFVAPAGTRPKIAEYNGLSPIGAWLRVVSMRLALSVLRKSKSAWALGREDVANRATIAAPDPELDYIKARYRVEFRESFHATVRGLDAEQKALLRLHYIDGLTVDELGKLFAVHRSTVARWIVRSRKQIVDETRRKLGEQLQMTASEIDSILRLVQSELERGLRGLLASVDEPGPEALPGR